MKLSLRRKCIHRGDLILVNAAHPYEESVHTADLITAGPPGAEVFLERRAAAALSRIMESLGGWGSFSAVSGWRSLREQKEIYAEASAENGSEFARKYVALSGCSEHQTGLAIDLALASEPLDFIRPAFPYTGICEAFRDLAVPQGFIERYPSKKESITGISHEPWHFRYVGAPHAEIMKKKGFCLEEYIVWVKQFIHGESAYCGKAEEKNFFVSYLPASQSEITHTEINNDSCYKISGNNIDGYIITEWR